MLKYHLFAIVNLFRRSSVISFSIFLCPDGKRRVICSKLLYKPLKDIFPKCFKVRCTDGIYAEEVTVFKSQERMCSLSSFTYFFTVKRNFF